MSTGEILKLVHQIADLLKPDASPEEILLVASLIIGAEKKKADVIELRKWRN